MNRVLVTGGTGFVGRQTVKAVKGLVDSHKWEVHVLGRNLLPSSDELFGQCVHHVVDLFDHQDVKDLLRAVQPTRLLHSAWNTEPGYWTTPENIQWVESSLNLVQAFARYGGKRIVCVGTCAEYSSSGGVCHDEHSSPDPSTPYGKSKDALRRVLEWWSTGAGVPMAWARLFLLHGPHEKEGRLVSSVCRSLLRGEPTKCGSGKPWRDLMHVEDAGRALATVLGSDLTGAVNIGSGMGVTIRTVVEKLAAIAGRPELAQFGFFPDGPNEPPLLVADVSRLRELGFEAKYSLDSGLEASFDWWKGKVS